MGDSWHAFKTGFARTKQKVLAKVGQAEVTKSPEYEEECQKVLALQKNMQRIHTNTGKYLEIMKELVAEQEAIAQDILLLADLGGSALQVATAMECERDTMAGSFGQYIDAPIASYMQQFKDLKDRMEQLEIRRVDMDRYFREYNSLMSKSNPDPARVAHVETKYNVTKDGYTALFNEMMTDMPKLLADKTLFFEPMIAAWAKTHFAFYSTTVNALELALSAVGDINEEQLQGHKPPLTPNENSAKYKIYRPATAGQNVDYYQSSPSHSSVSPRTTSPPRSSTISSPSFSVSPTAPISAYSPPSSSPPPSSVYTPPPAVQQHATAFASDFDSVGVAAGPPPSYVQPTAPSSRIRAKANFDFIAQDEGELSFRKGDIIIILDNNGDWWEGSLNGVTGSLPSNYVTVL